MRLRPIAAAVLLAAAAFAGSAPAALQPTRASDASLYDDHPGVALRRFSSADEFDRWLAELRERRRQALRTSAAGEAVSDQEFQLSGATNVEQAINSLPQVTPGNPEITNNQTVGVDEGGIVKQIGHFLIVLQDGRLFSIDLGANPGAPLSLASRVDVYRSRASAASWYDEMLVSGNRILVTAYDYREDATEISVFTLDQSGRIERDGRWLLSSDDYYSTENYATRLVGDNLVLYAPLSRWDDRAGTAMWPRLRRARGDGAPGEGRALIGPTEVYAPLGDIAFPVLHTLSICPLRGELDCRTTAFLGPSVRELYVSPTDAFLWLRAPDGLPWSIDYANRRRRLCPAGQRSGDALHDSGLLYRVPLDGGPVGAVAVDGTPEDQFSFDSRDGRLRALLTPADPKCRDWNAAGRLTLLDIPLSAFGPDVRRLAAGAYVPLPPIEEGLLENRFVGDWLVYGGRTGWSGLDTATAGEAARPTASTLWAVPLARPEAPQRVAIPHNALRIERAGRDAVVTGYRGDDGLSLSYVTLGDAPRLASTALLPGRYESEARSHAFGASLAADGSGLIGLPTSRRQRAGRGWSDSESSSLSFLRLTPGRTLVPAGELAVRSSRPATGYRCEVSCVDWYGNSRPIFTGGRILALMGTELVEGRMAFGRITTVGRLDLTGQARAAAR